ncbi:MAG: putative amino acid permease YhdG [Chlamydiales bacterium]|nr:putative amino acid permease YhdG [Chlamydiales bacterium]
MNSPPLKRTLSLWLITAYGLGTILGAGAYVLVGKVAGYAGLFAPLSFILASIVAAFTALSYAELCRRYPKAAGEAVYIQKAFGKKWLTATTGWLVVITGVVSAAALTRGFVGYFQVFVSASPFLIITVLILLLGLLAFWGIGQSVVIATIIALIEVAGLIFMISVSLSQLSEFPYLSPYLGVPEDKEWLGVCLGAFLAFYAFIGFEDMVNMAEEVRRPKKNLPLALFLALAIATLLYVLTALSVVLVIPLNELVETEAPFTLLFEKRGLSPLLITAISLVAILNGILVQIIMSARVLYGMGKQRAAPHFFSYVFPKTQTPLFSTALAALVILILALWFPIVTLAQMTSFVILIVFGLVNLSLIVMKKERLPKVIPCLGLLLCLMLLVFRLR